MTHLHFFGLCDVVWEEEMIVHLCVLPASRLLLCLGSPDLVWIDKSDEMRAKSNLRTFLSDKGFQSSVFTKTNKIKLHPK